MLLPESFIGAEGKAANTTPYKSGVNDWSPSIFSDLDVSELLAVRNGPREWVYIATCKSAQPYIHLGQSLLAQ